MGTLVESDIDQFIRGHKQKLQQERIQLNQVSGPSRLKGFQVISPSTRKQWDRRQAKDTRPAEEPNSQPYSEATSLQLGSDDQERKKLQLQLEQQKEDDDSLAKTMPARQNHQPDIPTDEGLPLGQYEQKRKALEKERNAEMKQAMEAKKISKVFDYKEVEKMHMAEKKQEYNSYLQKNQMHDRHMKTPEEGMFVGPDQSERDRIIREKNLAYKKELEKQRQLQLLLEARHHGEITQHILQNNALQRFQDERSIPKQIKDYTLEERAVNSPKQSLKRDPLEYNMENFNPKVPLYQENEGQIYEYRVQGQSNSQTKTRAVPDKYLNKNLEHKIEVKNLELYNKEQLSKPFELRRSRSLSPSFDVRRPRSISPSNERLHDKPAFDTEKRQQILQEEYRRDAAEEQRLATEGNQGLTLGDSNRQKLEEERKREYQEYIAKHLGVRSLRNKEVTPEHLRQGLPFDQRKHDEKKRQLEAERQKEYNELLQKQQQQARQHQADILEGTGATLPLGEYTVEKKQQLQEERHREYMELQQQKLNTDRQKGLPPKPPTPNHFFKNIGQHDKQVQILNEERKREYNQKLAKNGYRITGQESNREGAGPYTAGLQLKNSDSAQDNVYATLPGLKYSESAELRKLRTRNDEYNEYLKEKQFKDAHRMDHKKPPTAAPGQVQSLPQSPKRNPREANKNNDVFATLPGLSNRDSAEKRKIQERNKEYNDYLQQKQGGRKKGWITPTYEEILNQKRQEEALRRQDEEFGGPSRLRRIASEGAINKTENNYRDREIDKDLEKRKLRYDDEQQRNGGILEDDNWLNPSKGDEDYKQLVEHPHQPPREMPVRVQQAPAHFLASLPVGGVPGLNLGQDERESAKRRRQSDYRRELQLQMEETKAAKKREKIQELRVNASGLLDPEKNSNRIRGLTGEPEVSPRREFRSKEVQPYHTKFLLDDGGNYDALGRHPGEYEARSAPPPNFGGQDFGLGTSSLGGLGFRSSDDLRLNLGGLGGIERGRKRERDTGFLDAGLGGILESRRHIGTANPPPGLLYQPSTYVTAGGGGLDGPYSSIDEAYHYYGMKNPLDVDTGGGLPNLNLGDLGGGGGRGISMRGSSPVTRVTFAEEPMTSHRSRSKERISPYQFRSDDDLKPQTRQESQSYGAELERQIAEKRMQKLREKEEQERYERKLEEEIANYNPFGRGGGGAPIKDESGNPIADLRSLQRGTYQSPRQKNNYSPSYSPRPPSPRDDKIKPPPPQQTASGDPTFARGGHGIFGQPKTDAEKDQSDRYKDELRNQIAEKRRREQIEKDRERSEEEKENRRLEDQRKRMQEEYEEEQRKIRAREEETRRKNEELKKAADDRKKEAELKKREAEDSKAKEQLEQLERERREREQRAAEAEGRLKSPPVPAVKPWVQNEPNLFTIYQTEQRGHSPPVPANHKGRDSPSAISLTSQQTKASPVPVPVSQRPNSSDVLTQLASMRKQLQSERRRVENALENSKNEPDVFDPRTIQRPPPNKLIFENAVNKNASLPPPRAQTSDLANARNIQQFNELKFKENTESRRAFRNMFPEAPVTNTTLETQQDAMIRQQEAQLRALRERNLYDPTPSNASFGRHGNTSARSQLAANSAFIDVDRVNHFPEDFEDMPTRNDSARARRRDKFAFSPGTNALGSQTSLDVERIQKKNEERLRKLQKLTTTDDVSSADPDDILERFMTKQRYNRPASGQTLQDDSWLRPGSKAL